MICRPSTARDVPRLRELWTVAFGDSDAYQDNFFLHYYTPDRVLVLEVDNTVYAMTAWFGSELALPEGKAFRCGYLYAVATDPEKRGLGYASALLSFCDSYLKQHGYHAVSTVPARPDLHIFFGQNGFRECFVQGEITHTIDSLPPVTDTNLSLSEISPAQYRTLREQMLSSIAHINLDLDGIGYQHGACKLGDGGFFTLENRAIFALEKGEGDTFYLKEILGETADRQAALSLLPTVCTGKTFILRLPEGTWQFGMLKWLTHDINWNWDTRAYLGFAFD